MRFPPLLRLYFLSYLLMTVMNHSLTMNDGTSREPLRPSSVSPTPTHVSEPLDIEHMPVQNDPRLWSFARKVDVLLKCLVMMFTYCVQNVSLALISSASMIAGLAASIQNR